MEENYTLKMFMEDYEGFDFENGIVILFDADTGSQYFMSSDSWKMVYLTEERLNKSVWSWKHADNVMSIVLKGN